MHLTFLFPHPVSGPTGGYKVVYEYANRLVTDGHQVDIVYSGSIYWRRKSLYHKLTNVVRQVQWHIKGYSCKKWFPLDKRVKEYFSLSLNYRHVPKSDIYIATSPYTAYYLNQYPIPATGKFYFIQGYENWGEGLKEILFDTYHYPMQKIVISKWLQHLLLEEHGEKSEFIPNGFDFNKYHITIPIEEKDPLRISMLYHTMEQKDCATGFRALEIVKRQYPQLRVSLFGTPERPTDLADWYDYYRLPDDITHLRINNEAAIYIGTSQAEGWGLTIGEAMACGQAVCCTDNDGYLEMAIDKKTALVSPIGNAEVMAQNILSLIADPARRHHLARQGNAYIQQFSWERSYEKMREILTK